MVLRTDASPAERRQDMEKLRTALRNERMSSWDSHWSSIATAMLPRHQRFVGTPSSQAWAAGDRKDQFIVDPTATQALRTLSAGMMSGLTSPARPWFNLTTSDPALRESQAVKRWLDDVVNIMREMFLQSNLYDTLPQAYLDLGAFGVTAFEVLEDDTDTIRCYAYPIGSYYLACSHRNVVDTCVREFPMTVRQLCDRFGEERVSSKVKALIANAQWEERVDVVRVIRPNACYEMGSMHPQRRQWESAFYEMALTGGDDAGLFLEESGYYEFPVMAPRWGVIGEDVYGWSPGMDALGDVRELQTLKRRYAEAVYKMVSPPLRAPAAFANRPIRNVPGGVTYGDVSADRDGIRSLYDVNLRLDYLEQYIQKVQQSVRHVFSEDLFLMLNQTDRRQITAEEIRARQEEKIQALGPVVDRLMGELLNPLVERAFAILSRSKRLPPAPPELERQSLKIEYVSTMAQIQRATGLASMQTWLAGVMQASQVHPDALDKVNWDEAIDESATMLGVSPRVVRGDDEVQAIRQARAKQQAAAQAATLAESASKTVKNVAQAGALPQDPSANNPLSATLPGPGQAAGSF